MRTQLYYCTLLSTVECHLPFIKWKRDVFTLNHQKTLLNNIYRRLSFNWRLLQFKIKDKEEWELFSCPLLSTVAVSYRMLICVVYKHRLYRFYRGRRIDLCKACYLIVRGWAFSGAPRRGGVWAFLSFTCTRCAITLENIAILAPTFSLFIGRLTTEVFTLKQLTVAGPFNDCI